MAQKRALVLAIASLLALSLLGTGARQPAAASALQISADQVRARWELGIRQSGSLPPGAVNPAVLAQPTVTPAQPERTVPPLSLTLILLCTCVALALVLGVMVLGFVVAADKRKEGREGKDEPPS